MPSKPAQQELYPPKESLEVPSRFTSLQGEKAWLRESEPMIDNRTLPWEPGDHVDGELRDANA
jgi:hypothetical protein